MRSQNYHMSEKMGRSRAYAPVFSTFRRVFLIILIIIMVSLAFIGYRILKEKEAINLKKSQEIENLEDDIKIEDEKKESLSKNKDRNISDEEIMSIARDEFGLINKDEIVIKPR